MGVVALMAGMTLVAAPARASDFAIELETGLGIPTGSFPSFVPYGVDDSSGELMGTPNSAYNLLLDQTPTVGFTGALTVLFRGFSLRTAVSLHRWSKAQIQDYAFVRYDGVDIPKELHSIYLRRLLGDRGPTEKLDVPDSPVFTFLRWTLGYRFYLLDTIVRPFVPVGVGPGIYLAEGNAYPAISVHMGLGGEYSINDNWHIGLRVLYEYMGAFLPNDFQAGGLTKLWTGTTTANRSVWDGVISDMHTVQLTFSVLFRI